MKSSTIRRSTLSRETMEVIENLAKEQDANGLNEYVRPEDVETSAESSSKFQEKSQEIDLLWQTFKNSQFNTKSPMAYISLGFISGVASTLIVLGCLGLFVAKSDANTQTVDSSFFGKISSTFAAKKTTAPTLEEQADNAEDTMVQKVSVPGEDETSSANLSGSVSETAENVSDNSAEQTIDIKKSKKYIVKEGDTGESIIKRYFGVYSPEKAEMIIKANNLNNLDRINIGQELIIPIE